jgi:small subunit ribosomal protein S21
MLNEEKTGEIKVGKGKPIDRALREFKMEVRRSGVLDEIRKREHYAKPSQKRREEAEEARRKAQKNRREDY